MILEQNYKIPLQKNTHYAVAEAWIQITRSLDIYLKIYNIYYIFNLLFSVCFHGLLHFDEIKIRQGDTTTNKSHQSLWVFVEGLNEPYQGSQDLIFSEPLPQNIIMGALRHALQTNHGNVDSSRIPMTTLKTHND